ILNNSSVKWLPGQEPAGVKALGATFGLGEAETRYLEGAPRGHGLLLSGRQRIRLEVRATPRGSELLSRSKADSRSSPPGTPRVTPFFTSEGPACCRPNPADINHTLVS